MADIVNPKTRSRMMAGIKGKDTKPETAIRHALHRRGYRYRLHNPNLSGKPDLVFSSRQAVIMINGCFWHAHDCHLFRWPATREEFWRRKLGRNRERDEEIKEALVSEGWRVLLVWECALKGKTRKSLPDVIDYIADWLDNGASSGEIKGDS